MINARFVHGGIRIGEWQGYINQVFRILKPGVGWAQFMEAKGPPLFENGIEPEVSVIPKASHSFFLKFFADMQLTQCTETLFGNQNTPCVGGLYLVPFFVNAGFVDIEVVEKHIDLGGWRRGVFIGELN